MNGAISTPTTAEILKERILVEYKALRKLIIIVVTYWAVVNFISIFLLMIYFYARPSVTDGVSGWWSSIFLTFSAFNNAGFALNARNLIPMASDYYVLILLSILILFGNTAFPIVLRFIVFVIHRYKEKNKPKDLQVYKFMMKNPRRVYTHLFPAYETKFLVVVLAVTLLLELIAFVALDWNREVLAPYRGDQKILIGYFQSVCTRTGGFNVVDLSMVHSAVLVMYVAFMYISAYPVAITVRNSNVSDVYISADTGNTVKVISQKLIVRDVLVVYLAFFVICILEAPSLDTENGFTIFALLFEVVSAYGTVGISLGHPTTVASLSTRFSTTSKLIMCVVMLLGRHRGLPDSVDQAVQLPKELKLFEDSTHKRIEDLSNSSDITLKRTELEV